MIRLRKTQPPFGTADNPQYEPTYSEGLIPVVDGICEVRLPETRDRLLKLGYEEVAEPEADGEESAGRETARRGSGRRR